MTLRKIPGRKSAADYLREHRDRVAATRKIVMTTFEQRCRDAQTILEAFWPQTRPQLPQDVRELVASIMVAYAIQCELAILREMKE